MLRQWTQNSSLTHLAVLISALALVTTGCGEDDGHDDNHDHENHDHENHDNQGHQDEHGWLQIESTGDASEVLAIWDEEHGWEDGDEQALTSLTVPGDESTTWSVRFYDADGDPLDQAPLSEDESTGYRECDTYSMRYYPAEGQEDTTAIYWGLITHPDHGDAPAQFVDVDGDAEPVFGCDQVTLWPNEGGEVDLEFVLWHEGHSDQVTDPLSVVLE